MKPLEEKIIEILDNRMDCDGQFITGMGTSAKEIASMMKEFVEWNMDENNETIIGILYSDYDGDDIVNYLFDYWINNIKNDK